MQAAETATPTDPSCTEPEAEHRHFRQDEFWRDIPGFADVDAATFHTHLFQMRNSITSVGKLMRVMGDRVDAAFYADLSAGLAHAPMSIRLSPYLVSLVDWQDPVNDPIRRQFLPLGSEALPDHPELHLDALQEQADSPVPGLTHRYPDRALFLTLDTCPVYCRFCTRSYAVGLDTDDVTKVHMAPNRERWEQVFDYVRSTPRLEDIVISGGDTYNLKPDQIRLIGNALLDIDHVRRFRFATKGPAVMPQKILTDHAWTDALTEVVDRGRSMHKEVVVHTHFNHPAELTGVSLEALRLLTGRGITVRNQGVLQRRVNDDAGTMRLLVKKLSFANVQPYYIFFHDLVSGVEDLRTTLRAGVDLEKEVRGVTAGFNTPTFIVDTLGGGGKRDCHSYEHYDEENGIAVFTSPAVRPGRTFLYFDPIDVLGDDARVRWADEGDRRAMIREAVVQAGGKGEEIPAP